MTVTKQHIVDILNSSLNEHSRDRYLEITETLLELMKRTLESGEDILITGFGKFQVKEKKPRKGRDPSTGKDLILPARRVVTFNCSKKLRQKMNGEI